MSKASEQSQQASQTSKASEQSQRASKTLNSKQEEGEGSRGRRSLAARRRSEAESHY